MLAVLVSEKILSSLPPFFPEEKTLRLSTLIKEKDEEMLKTQAENQLIKLGYELWPYKKAFSDFVKLAEEEVADHFLLPLLPEDTVLAYEKYREFGMKFSDLYSGAATDYFPSDEHMDLMRAVSVVKEKIDKYAYRQITSLAENVYHKKVKEYSHFISKVKKELEHLKDMSEKEKDFPVLSGEIKEKVRIFEESICGMGSDINLTDVFNLKEFFTERKKHLLKMQGFTESVEIDFYS